MFQNVCMLYKLVYIIFFLLFKYVLFYTMRILLVEKLLYLDTIMFLLILFLMTFIISNCLFLFKFTHT